LFLHAPLVARNFFEHPSNTNFSTFTISTMEQKQMDIVKHPSPEKYPPNVKEWR